MKNIISYFIKYPISADVLVLLIALMGYFGLQNMRSTFFPEAESRLITVTTVYPGTSPEEIEEGIILKIEDNLSGIAGIERITSISQENTGSVVIQIDEGFDMDEALTDVKNAVDRISSFPSGMEPPTIAKSEALTNAINFGINGDTDLKTLKSFARKIEADLLAIDGISKVALSGFPEEELVISVRENDLRRYNLTFDQVALAVGQANIDVSGGTIKGSTEELQIRSRNKGYYAKDLENLIVATNADGRQVRLYEVADVEDRWSETVNYVYINGKPGVYINVNNTQDEDLIEISEDVNEYLTQFNEENDIVHALIINDASILLNQRINLLLKNGGVGFILVLVMLAMFLQIRLAFWVAIAIPISFLGMFIIASFVGVSINVLSLFGMILVVGILVDDGIVISENIYRHYEMGKKPFEAALVGTMEVLPAVTGAILTTVVAFASFLFIEGTVGTFFSDVAIVVMLTLTFSLIEGALVLPAHIAHSKALQRKVGPDGKPIMQNGGRSVLEKIQQVFWDGMNWMKNNLYAPSLRFFLKNTVLSLFIPLGILIVTISLVPGGFVKTTFFPTIEADFITANLKFPAGTPEEITAKGLDQMEAAVWKVNEEYKAKREDGKDVVLILSKNLGTSGNGFVQDASSLASGGGNIGTLFINLLDSEARDIKALELVEAFREATGEVFGADQMTYSIAGPFGDAISISVRGNNLAELTQAVNELKDRMAEIPDLRNIKDNNQIGLKEVNINLKEKAYLLGVNPQFVIGQIRQGFFGAEVQRIQRGKDEVKVWVRYSDEDRSSIGKLENMRIRTGNGSSYPLNELADLDFSRGIIAINHLDNEREIRVTSDLASDDVSSTDMTALVTDSIMPGILAKYPTVRYSLEGQAQQSEQTIVSAQTVLPIAFFLIITIIIITFRSWSQTLAVGLMIPFGFIGVILGHFLLSKAISLLSMMGVFALIGVMVNDGLVLVNAHNNLIKAGKPFREAIYEASLSRFRPIFLTSLTTVAGLLPLIFEKSFQAQFLIPVAISIAFGLIAATLVILVTLPTLLVMFNQYKGFVIWLWRGEYPDPASIEPAYEGRESNFWLYVITSVAFIMAIYLVFQVLGLFF